MIGAILADEAAKMLRLKKGWDDSRCSVAPQGQPWASSGDFFVGLYPTEDINLNMDHVYYRYATSHGFVVRISRRVLATPSDRYHKLYVKETKSLCTLAHSVRKTLLDFREDIRANVNTYFTDNNFEQDYHLVRTFNWTSTSSEISERDPSWFRSTQESMKIDSFNPAGFSIDVVFGNAMGVIETDQ